jgi:dienelactone hydrolase
MKHAYRVMAASILVLTGSLVHAGAPLEGTQPLALEEDFASQIVDGADRFLLQEISRAAVAREHFWKRDLSSPEAYERAIDPHRKRLAHILGVRDERTAFNALELVATTDRPALLARRDGYEIFAVRWPAFGDVFGEGLLLVPVAREKVADVIAVPDADQTPEQLVGLVEGVPVESQFAGRLAESGCRVVVPLLINRKFGDEKVPGVSDGKEFSNREFLYRSAFMLGRGIGGYEVQKLLSLVDWLAKANEKPSRIGVFGYGEGGRLALFAAALDRRIGVTGVSGYFDNRDRIWQEPIDRNVFGLLEQFGDAELATMVVPRDLIIEASKASEVVLSGKGGGAPAQIVTPKLEQVRKEFSRAQETVSSLKPRFELVVSGDGDGPFGTTEALAKFLACLAPSATLAESGGPSQNMRPRFDTDGRHARQMHEIDRHNQQLLADCFKSRDQFMNRLDTSSPEKFAETSEEYRRIFYDEVIGRFKQPLLPANPRTRQVDETDHWTRYEVVLDVFPDVIAYGLLTIPKNLASGERRPVVVCQHGLEGRPQDVIGEQGSQYYSAFATRLAERGYITFAPQNLYIFKDRFRTLQRKANAIGKTLFSVIVPQHQQITDWLKTLPQVDPERIAFYGMSYGGKSAMRIPPLVKNYCLSICSADFNEWVVKCASTTHSFSYAWKSEYEIFEFDLGNTFNYAEMATLIAPRPFMVERGHLDGVGTDEMVAFEFAKVFRFYETRLHLGDRCEIEWFNGPHKINGVGTYKFLDKHLSRKGAN